MDRAPEARHQFLRHRQRLRPDEVGRPSPRRSSAAGSPRAAGDASVRAGHQALRRHGRDWPNEGKLSARNIRRACDACLRALQTDYIDLYQMHHIDRETPWDEIWEAMEVLRQQGKVIYVGSSNFAGWHIAKAQESRRRRNFIGPGPANSRSTTSSSATSSMEVLPACRDLRPGRHPLVAAPGWSARRGPAPRGVPAPPLPGQAAETSPGACTPLLEAYEDLSPELGDEPAAVGLAWLLTRPASPRPSSGPAPRSTWTAARRAVDVDLDDGVLAALDKLFPRHKPAPEDYAW